MKLAVTQPYFFPYAGLYQLAYAADRFIVFDTPQYRRKSWMCRNRVFNKDNGWSYINLGCRKAEFKCTVKDVQVDPGEEWKIKFLHSLNSYKNEPNYSKIYDLVRSVIYSGAKTLTEMDMLSMKNVLEYLGIDFRYELLSEMDIDISEAERPMDHSLILSKKLKATTYINMPAGSVIFDEQFFSDAGISLMFLSPEINEYKQARGKAFEPNLSIIDMLMFLPDIEVASIIKNSFRLLPKKELLKSVS